MGKKLSVILLAVVTVLICQLSFLYYQFVSAPTVHERQIYQVKKGINSRQLAHQLAQQGSVRYAWFFEAMARVQGKSRHLQSGEYQWQAGMTEQQILIKIAHGDVVQHHVTLIEGSNLTDVFALLQENPYLQHDLQQLSRAKLAKRLGISQKNPEGWFFPDTYQFVRDTPESTILTQAHQRMQQELKQAWSERAENLPYKTPYQALIVASMVEKEAHLARERPIIAGVILRRLKKRMRLQIDPTVIYGLGENYTGRLTHANLRKKTPYNTYTMYGLPPTPIALPSKAAIIAALHPDQSDALYFVAKGDGSHVFSATLKAQNKAVKQYILKR